MEASAAPRPAGSARRRGRDSPRLLRLASDERLVTLVRDGSQAAFETVYDRHHRGILSFCRHMLGSQEEAEDALQHTFMAAYRALCASEKDIQLRAWLYAIARNRCLSLLRARRERPADDLDEPSTEGLATEVQRRHDLRDMLRDLAHLPDDQRAALVLSELGDLPHDEIAAVIGCHRDKVKALVFQARTSLQASREARETPCAEIREQLASLRGGSLRRTALRRHVRECAGCRAFQEDVRRQRRAMAAVLPVIPAVGLKESALAAAFAGKGGAVAGAAGAATAAGAAGTAGLLAGGPAALVGKALVVAAVAGGGAAGVEAVRSSSAGLERESAPVLQRQAPAGTPSAGGEASGDRPGRRRGHDDRGREWAKTRGKGRKRGLFGTQPRAKGERSARTERGKPESRGKARADRPQRPAGAGKRHSAPPASGERGRKQAGGTAAAGKPARVHSIPQPTVVPDVAPVEDATGPGGGSGRGKLRGKPR